MKSVKNSRFADNTSGLIEEVDHRDMWEDAADSFAFLSDVGNSVIDTGSVIFASDFYKTEPVMSFGQFNAGGGLGGSSTFGETFGVDSTENCLGVASISTGSSTAGGATGSISTTPAISFGNGFTFVLKWRCALETLSDGTDTYTASIGFHDVTTSGNAVDGAYFRYTHGTNSGKWEAVTISNSAETAEDTGVTAEVDVYHIFEVRVNSDASQVDFYIDGSKTNDITTNIPSGSARMTNVMFKIEKTAGSTTRKLYADYVQLVATRSTAR